MTIFAWTGTVLSVFLLMVLLAKRPRAPADRWLAVWLALQVLYCAGPVAADLLPVRLVPFVLAGSQLSLFCLGPAQYLYAATALGAPRRLAWHAATVVWAAAALAAILLLIRPRAVGGVLLADAAPSWLVLVPLSAVLLAALHPLAVLRLARRRREFLAERLSSLASADPEWLGTWALATLATMVLVGAALVGSLLLGWGAAVQTASILGLQVASIIFVGQRGLTRHQVFFAAADRMAEVNIAPPTDPAEARADFARVAALLEAEQLHLEPGLTARTVADHLGWAPERLTRALRDGGGMNFFTFVNNARVRAVQEAIADPANAGASVLALGYDAGFGSKTAIYDAFNRCVGCSPAEWRDRVIRSRNG